MVIEKTKGIKMGIDVHLVCFSSRDRTAYFKVGGGGGLTQWEYGEGVGEMTASRQIFFFFSD